MDLLYLVLATPDSYLAKLPREVLNLTSVYFLGDALRRLKDLEAFAKYNITPGMAAELSRDNARNYWDAPTGHESVEACISRALHEIRVAAAQGERTVTIEHLEPEKVSEELDKLGWQNHFAPVCYDDKFCNLKHPHPLPIWITW